MLELLGTLSNNVQIWGLVALFCKAALITASAFYLSRQYQRSSAAIRHRLWVCALIILAVMPLWTWLSPTLELQLANFSQWKPASPSSTLTVVALLTYIGIASAKLVQLFTSLWAIAQMTSRAEPAHQFWLDTPFRALAPAARVLQSSEVESPLTWGYIKPIILIPSDASCGAHERDMIMLHEYSHITRADWLYQLMGQLVALLFWPVPGIRSLVRRMSTEAEQACDDCVLQRQYAAADYAALLLRQAHHNRLPATVALGHDSELGQRIRSLCSNNIDHSVRELSGIWLYPLCILVALPVSSLQLTEWPKRSIGSEIKSVFRINSNSSDNQNLPDISILRPEPPPVVYRPPLGTVTSITQGRSVMYRLAPIDPSAVMEEYSVLQSVKRNNPPATQQLTAFERPP